MQRVLLGFLLALGATPALADATADIQSGEHKWEQAFARGDAAGLAQLYTEGATLMAPGAPAQKGRPAIEQFMGGMFKPGSAQNITITTDSVEDYGKAAREIGHFALDVKAADGQPARLEGKYVAIWKPEGGSWKLDSDIWNLDK